MRLANAREPWVIFGFAVFALLLIAIWADHVTKRLRTVDYCVADSINQRLEILQASFELQRRGPANSGRKPI